ncbi:MAG TPA: substrate-binding domain-containing protein, partial [Planctomycetota bacterium]|nr:substrate-binding domain-containing protein [Planctomycetota bacterium]
MRRIHAAIAIALAALLGCSRGESLPKIGVSLLAKQDPFYQQLQSAMEAAAAPNGFSIQFASADKSTQKQLGQVEDFIAQKVAAIVLCPVDSDAAAAAVDVAKRAGVPVFTADIEAHSPDVVCHVASDNVAGGRAAAKALIAAMGEDGEVLIIDHPEVSSVQDRVRGFEDEVAKHPRVKIVGKPPGGGDRSRSDRAMQDALHSHPNLRGVFGINDNTAL